MGEETNPKPDATEAMDVDGPPAATGHGASLSDKLMANVVLIDHAVMTKEQKLISSRLLRQTQGLKKDLTPQGIVDFVKHLFSAGGVAGMDDGEAPARRTEANLERITRALGECGSLAEGAPLDWASPVVVHQETSGGDVGGDVGGDMDGADGGKGSDATKEGGAGASSVVKKLTVNPDLLEIYVYLVTCMMLVDNKAWKDALNLSQAGIQLAISANSRIITTHRARRLPGSVIREGHLSKSH